MSLKLLAALAALALTSPALAGGKPSPPPKASLTRAASTAPDEIAPDRTVGDEAAPVVKSKAKSKAKPRPAKPVGTKAP